MKLNFRSTQRGATLVIGMIMLILVTLFVLAAINMSTTNLQVMGNEQARNEAIAAAQQVIEQVSSRDFTTNPVAVTATVDVAGNGSTGYSVAVAAPRCLNSVPIKLTELDPTNSNDVPCFGSAASSAAGVPAGTGTGDSFCSATQWDLDATSTDPTNNTGTSVTLHQGVSKRIATGASPC
ncbi:MAG: pilus assembly PilX N-terminal domain-containing protein [Betaproteobacteria bacterium]|nr:pilus assembly protein [Betaproteobacteria bacterium]MDE2209788.1 pilus assembly PilX N-terminal domain-containing protein [Betaproteobacteria bacterium]